MSTEIERKIREFGSKKNWPSLQEYIENIDADEIEELIRRKIHNPDFESLWNYLLHGFVDSYDSQKKRYKILHCCVETLRDKDVNATNAFNIITRLRMELFAFKTDELVSLCQLCVGYIQKGNVTESCWKDLLPEIVNVVRERDHVEYNDVDMSGFEYKTQVVKSLLLMDWSPNIIIALTSMFIDMLLTKDEHLEVVKKLVRYMEKLTPQEIPPFVYQLLRFCNTQNSKAIFFRLQGYFGARIYNKPVVPESSCDSMDIISDAIDDEVQQAESTVLYHIYQAALLGDASIKEYLNSLKNLIKTPEFILHPYQLTVLLAISPISFYEDTVFAIIRQSVARNVHEEEKNLDSTWLKTMVPNSLDLEEIFKKIIENSDSARDFVLQGLINVSFVFLGVGALLGRESSYTTKQWNLGKFILVNLIKRKTHLAQSVLKKLYNYIIANGSTVQYIDCFREISKKFMMLIYENKNCVFQLIEALLIVSEPVAKQILDSVIPLTKVSPTIRDHLILLLRKGLYARDTSTRQIAVTGFLKLLINLKISNLTALSQTSSSQSSGSGRSLLTQISLNRSVHGSQGGDFSEEAICLELLGILKCCFTNQVDVRAKMYEDLYDAVSRNPDIGGPVLEFLWSHFRNYYTMDEDVCPPIDFKKVSVLRDVDAVLEEPMGKFTFSISLIVIKVQANSSENSSARMFTEFLDSMVTRMIKCELIHFELDDGSYLLDILPECQKKIITLKEAMRVYEALIGYRIASWVETSENFAQDVNGLFQGYFRLQQCAKNAQKPGKKGAKKKKDADKTQNKSADSQVDRSTQNGDRSTQKGDNSTLKLAAKARHVKIPDTVLDFESLTKFLNLLHGTVSWTSVAQATVLKSKQEIHQHVMSAVIHLFQGLKSVKSIENQPKYYQYSVEIGTIIYTRCVNRLEDFVEFDSQTAVLATECFHAILNLVCGHYRKHLPKFLCKVGGQELHSSNLLECISPFLEKYKELFEFDFNSGESDQDIKRLKLALISTLALITQQLPTQTSVESNNLLEWLKTYSTQNSPPNKLVAGPFISLWFSSYVKFKSSVSLFEEVVDNLTFTFGSLTEGKTGTQTFKIIDDHTAPVVLEKLTGIIKIILDDLDSVTNRMKAEFGVLSFPGGDSTEKLKENLKTKERGVCCQLCLIINLIDSICDTMIPTVPLWEGAVKVTLQLYSCLNTLAKHFISRSTHINPIFQNARFERVVKLAGKQLPSTINKLILWFEENQTDEDAVVKQTSEQLKKKVLRETKLIPKLVYEMEMFTKFVIQLSKKSKVDLAKMIGPGVTRDFRIRDIESCLQKNADRSSDSLDRSVDESTRDEEENTDDESLPPPTKKSKA